MNNIKQAFKEILTYSQGIDCPEVDKLFEDWAEAKKEWIQYFGNKLIYEFYRAMYIYYKKHHADESSFLVNIVVYIGIAVLCVLKLFLNLFKKKS